MKKFIFLIVVLLAAFSGSVVNTFSQEMAMAGGRWPASTDGVTRIPVCWENASGFTTETGWVRSAVAATWESAAKIDLQGWGQCAQGSRGIRILVKDDRSKSYMGRYMDGMYGGMELNFTFQNFSPSCQRKREGCVKAIAVHEFGHALGLAHEQDRPDSVCRDSQVQRGHIVLLTDYDPLSVMNYCNPNWNNDGRLSEKDVAGIQKVYGRNVSTAVTRGSVSVMDELGDDQVWETVSISFAGVTKSISLDSSRKSQTVEWPFEGDGSQCFKFSTRALHSDGRTYEGQGEKCFTLRSGTRYSPLALMRDGWNSNGYFNITLK